MGPCEIESEGSFNYSFSIVDAYVLIAVYIMYSLLCNQSILFMHLYHTIIQFIRTCYIYIFTSNVFIQNAGGMVSNIASADRIPTSYPPIAKVSLVYYMQPKLIAYGALKLFVPPSTALSHSSDEMVLNSRSKSCLHFSNVVYATFLFFPGKCHSYCSSVLASL